MEKILKGLATAITDDEVVENSEIVMLHRWLTSIELPESGPVRELRELIDAVCADGIVTSKERSALLQFLKSLARHMPASDKGYEFEKYVLSRFDKHDYRIHEWRSDKFLRGWGGPPSNSSPDIELEHIQTGRRFAIECKYRTGLSNGKFMWATPRKRDNYIRYQQHNHTQVFVAFGLGGQPRDPAFFAVMPLIEIKYPGLFLRTLEPYRRNTNRLTLAEIEHPTRGSCVRQENS